MAELIVRSSVATPVSAFLRPSLVAGTLVRHRELIGQFARREVMERHKGAYLGAAWNVVNPLLSLAIYTFVFGYVFHSRWEEAAKTNMGGAGGGGVSGAFVLPFFLGHALFHFFSECVNRAPNVVASRSNLVKRVVFPVEILPVVAVLSSLVYPIAAVACLLAVQVAITGTVPVTALLLPVVALPLAPMCLGIGWILAALGVYVRDVRHVTLVLTQLSMFLTPVFYPVERIPESWRGLYMLNPVAIVIENSRAVMLWGRMPDWGAWGVMLAGSLALMQAGYAVFMRARRGLSDVI
ncbi:MAG: ABC transporter permease [Phycisphaerales bacterium]|nr:ABC transporter permease [Phycisphaerales bacterium]